MEVALNLALFATLCLALLAGFPVAFTLSGVALLFGLLGYLLGVFDMAFVSAIPNRIYGNAMTTEILVAVPLFVFMGVALERAKIAEELLSTMATLFGRLRGGLSISVSVVGALLAASTGIVGATVVTMGLLSLPAMLKYKYDIPLACGSICAAGTLGQIIPPSIILIILGDQISNAYVDAQRELGNFSPEPVSIGDLFAGALIPGLMLVGMYIVYQAAIAWLRPDRAPAISMGEVYADNDKLLSRVLHALVPPLALVIAVLGSILAGVATPTEAASVGATGAILLAALRLPLDADSVLGRKLGPLLRLGSLPEYAALFILIGLFIASNAADMRITRDWQQMSTYEIGMIIMAMLLCVILALCLLLALIKVWVAGILRPVMQSTLHITSMVFVILIGASLFSLVFRGFGGDEMVQEFLLSLPGGVVGAMLVVMLIMFLLGFFLDFIEISFVVVPIVAPILLAFDGISPIWLGIMFAINLQTSFLTPPFGFALFYLRGVAPPEVRTTDIYKGIIPFVIIQLLALALLAVFPNMAHWLPEILFDSNFEM